MNSVNYVWYAIDFLKFINVMMISWQLNWRIQCVTKWFPVFFLFRFIFYIRFKFLNSLNQVRDLIKSEQTKVEKVKMLPTFRRVSTFAFTFFALLEVIIVLNSWRSRDTYKGEMKPNDLTVNVLYAHVSEHIFYCWSQVLHKSDATPFSFDHIKHWKIFHF